MPRIFIERYRILRKDVEGIRGELLRVVMCEIGEESRCRFTWRLNVRHR